LNSIDAYVHGFKSRAQNHHCIGYGAFPVEVTTLKTMRKRYSKHVRPVTLTPFFIKAVALAVRDNPRANSILFQRNPFRRKIVSFDAIDVNVPITRDMDGETLTFIGIVRGADKLTIAEIQDELLQMQRTPPQESPYLEKIQRLRRASPLAVSLYHWLMSRSPSFYLKNAGTCGVTTLDTMPGGNFFPIGPTTLVFAISGIGEEVVARSGTPVVRSMLHVSLAIDNFVLGGPEALKLSMDFQRIVETCSFVKSELGQSA
jgi:pyruvate/2-oxoglutarate dehydrogenase complex dihydrolipoamide acyltransferase (E2) component